MSEGGTQEVKHASSWIDVQATSAVKSQMLLTSNTSRDEERIKSSEGVVITLPRKASSQR